MKFNQRAWVTDIAVSTIATLLASLVIVWLVPEAPSGWTILTGGCTGFVRGLVSLPLKWLIERRPPADEDDEGGTDE